MYHNMEFLNNILALKVYCMHTGDNIAVWSKAKIF